MPTPSAKPNARPVRWWLYHSSILFMVAVAVAMAFPKLIGSNDDPSYALTVCFLSLAVVLWVCGNPKSSSS
ncbi:MAG: hypothetical protein HN742_01910 [Lentisphaerae bacterium]|jgi:hypothetical protein|nr:hypothetical protein [Lentisphaerota bacterium]MBT4820543.1 hypothetical protein [Lentisphaerota bacterium]MBT5612363.1 hypothetical protein [Lentisphaerota bacterium]MBT7056667.1 hypothetical protein [Lentisphaerota bacterium]MBT7840592.1 hypothetical protein [Lentisphaerota bacterium]